MSPCIAGSREGPPWPLLFSRPTKGDTARALWIDRTAIIVVVGLLETALA